MQHSTLKNFQPKRNQNRILKVDRIITFYKGKKEKCRMRGKINVNIKLEFPAHLLD